METGQAWPKLKFAQVAATTYAESANRFAEKSLQLQRILRAAGFAKGDGVNILGLRLVSTIARANGLRDWPETRSLDDYDRLIAAVTSHLSLP